MPLSPHFISFASLACMLASGQALATFDSPFFSYEDAREAKNLSVLLAPQSANWQSKNVVKDDIPFHQDLFANPAIMAGFADGQPRDRDATKARIENMWLPRFERGQPHGGLTIFAPENGQRIGHVVAGGGEGAGVSEIAYSLIPDYWGKKITGSVVRTLVQEWAPEVRRIGLGRGYDTSAYANIQKAFTCFGGQVLAQFDATASPSNTGSWRILDKSGFKAAKSKVQQEDYVLSLDGLDLNPEQVEERLLGLYASAQTLEPLINSVRYRMVDTQGTLRTFSKHDRFNRIKYHFELKLDQL